MNITDQERWEKCKTLWTLPNSYGQYFVYSSVIRGHMDWLYTAANGEKCIANPTYKYSWIQSWTFIWYPTENLWRYEGSESEINKKLIIYKND